MTMRQLRNRLTAELNKTPTKGPRKIPKSPDATARVVAGNCRYCGTPLLADGEGGWTCPRRDQHPVESPVSGDSAPPSRKFRKKPVVIEAVQIRDDNMAEIESFCRPEKRNIGWAQSTLSREVTIVTLEGKMTGLVGDWIIRDVAGELYPCKPAIFEKTYEPVE